LDITPGQPETTLVRENLEPLA